MRIGIRAHDVAYAPLIVMVKYSTVFQDLAAEQFFHGKIFPLASGL